MAAPALTPEELVERVDAYRRPDIRRPDVRALEQWLLAEGFAVRIDGRLVPTPLARQVGGSLAQVERDTGRGR